MSEERTRRLVAVWFADIVGYTSLSSRDEDGALAVVDVLQGLARDAVDARGGRIVKFQGDAVLSVFDSANAALRSASELQRGFAESVLAREKGCALRIGVHLGEVVEADDGDVYGDGVNLASRIESQAEPGQILVSEDVYRVMRSNAAHTFLPMSRVSLKGIPEPVTLYALAGDGDEAGTDPSATEADPSLPLEPGQVFVSYKREDEPRVAPLVRALEEAGLSVWWDRDLRAAESWRSRIEASLEAAGCVIVVWSRRSVSAEGDFVRDEATRAKAKGILVPVLIDDVSPPLGFGEMQAIDLTRWRGRSRDPSFRDLVATLEATLAGEEPPVLDAPRVRIARTAAFGSMIGAASFALGGFALNAFAMQDRVCSLPLAQPVLSDGCGALGLGDRPTSAERVAWDSMEPGSCDALREHIVDYPGGAYQGDAADFLAARRIEQTESWIPSERRLALFVGQGEAVSLTEGSARAEALERAVAECERQCRGFSATGVFRLTGSSPIAEVWECSTVAGGIVCGFRGEAACLLEERVVTQREICGPGRPADAG